jgi:hypothetical protein
VGVTVKRKRPRCVDLVRRALQLCFMLAYWRRRPAGLHRLRTAAFSAVPHAAARPLRVRIPPTAQGFPRTHGQGVAAASSRPVASI